ncbi:glutaminase [Brevibacterium sp. GP-SGM9]|uniref:glutaminase n=1 Tax=Brevibacterium sp. GP-SGM9 TaxID=3376990 RepID=UPI0039A57136
MEAGPLAAQGNNAGLPLNSVMAIELDDGKPMNSMVNAGAIAITALVPGESQAEKWEAIRVEIYTLQCSLSGTAHDLAVMGATRADGGINPLTGRAQVARDLGISRNIFYRRAWVLRSQKKPGSNSPVNEPNNQ